MESKGVPNTEKVYKGLSRHRGSITELAKRCNCTPEWCRLVLSGKGNDIGLIEKAADLWQELETAQAERLQKVDLAINKAETIMHQNLNLLPA